MGYFVAFPTHLVEELLQFLPDGERPVYAERFEPIVSDLVWVRDDAENAIRSALRKSVDPLAARWRSEAIRVRECVEALMEEESEALVTLAQEALFALAADVIQKRIAQAKAGGPDASPPME